MGSSSTGAEAKGCMGRPARRQSKKLTVEETKVKIKLGMAVAAGMLMTAGAGFGAVIFKSAPPPPASVAVLGKAPSSRYVWVPGYYKGVHRRYVWMAGRWALPPRPGAAWVPPRWVARSGGYVFVAGYWR